MKMFYARTNSREFDQLTRHLVNLGHDGFDAMLGSMHEVAEQGLQIMQGEAGKRTQRQSGKLLSSFSLGNKNCVYDVGENDVVFGSALYYAGMVNDGHAIVPPGFKRDYRRQKRRKKENQRYDYYEGAKFFNPAFNKIEKEFFDRMGRDLGLLVENTSFVRSNKRKKKRKGAR